MFFQANPRTFTGGVLWAGATCSKTERYAELWIQGTWSGSGSACPGGMAGAMLAKTRVKKEEFMGIPSGSDSSVAITTRSTSPSVGCRNQLTRSSIQ